MNPNYILPMDDLPTLRSLEDIILTKRKTLFRKPDKEEGIVFIVSGGLDSTTALARVINEFESQIYPLYVQRGARNEANELASLRYYLKLFSNNHPNLHELEILEAEVPPRKYKKDIPEVQLNAIGHTMRNSMLQSYAIQYAVSVGHRDNIRIRTVFTSLVPDDDLPHCRLISLRAETILACIDGDDWSWQITSPLLESELWGWIDKTIAIKYAFEHNLDLSHTYTCTDSSDIACGVCPACVERLKAFKASGHDDPIKYRTNKKDVA